VQLWQWIVFSLKVTSTAFRRIGSTDRTVPADFYFERDNKIIGCWVVHEPEGPEGSCIEYIIPHLTGADEVSKGLISIAPDRKQLPKQKGKSSGRGRRGKGKGKGKNQQGATTEEQDEGTKTATNKKDEGAKPASDKQPQEVKPAADGHDKGAKPATGKDDKEVKPAADKHGEGAKPATNDGDKKAKPAARQAKKAKPEPDKQCEEDKRLATYIHDDTKNEITVQVIPQKGRPNLVRLSEKQSAGGPRKEVTTAGTATFGVDRIWLMMNTVAKQYCEQILKNHPELKKAKADFLARMKDDDDDEEDLFGAEPVNDDEEPAAGPVDKHAEGASAGSADVPAFSAEATEEPDSPDFGLQVSEACAAPSHLREAIDLDD
jgi:hypothetical protein